MKYSLLTAAAAVLLAAAPAGASGLIPVEKAIAVCAEAFNTKNVADGGPPQSYEVYMGRKAIAMDRLGLDSTNRDWVELTCISYLAGYGAATDAVKAVIVSAEKKNSPPTGAARPEQAQLAAAPR